MKVWYGRKVVKYLWCSRYSDSLRARQFDVLSPVEARNCIFSTPVQNGPGVPGLFPGG